VRKSILSIVFSFLAFITVLSCSPPQVNPINEVFVFGDSLSDVGAVFRVSGGLYPPDPPYFQGRYSNGRIWVEYLIDRLQLSQNQVHHLAYGGATTGITNTRAENLTYPANLVPNLLNQIQTVVQPYEQSNQSMNADALYILWVGANDYLQGSTTTVTPIANLNEAIHSLITVGARRLLIANLPDLGQLPATRNTANSEALSTLTQQHNQELERSLINLTQEQFELQIAFLNVSRLYQEVITAPQQFGFTNAVNACLGSSEGGCENPDRFLFWDGIHPTTAAHRHLSDAAFTALQQSEMVKES
jgi:thermolabile hemolysin